MLEHGTGANEPTRSEWALHALRSHVQPGSFPLLLTAITLVYVVNGLAITSAWGAHLTQGARIGGLFASIYVLSAKRVTLWLAVFLAALAFALEVQLWALDSGVGRVLQDVVTVGFYLWILVVVMRAVFRPATAESDAVVGALCGFLIILGLFTRVHGLLEALSPGSYHADGPPFSERPGAAVGATFQYFSTITMTTVGFGDMVPVTPAARLVTGLEAILGQLYVAVVIATLVGRVAGRRR